MSRSLCDAVLRVQRRRARDGCRPASARAGARGARLAGGAGRRHGASAPPSRSRWRRSSTERSSARALVLGFGLTCCGAGCGRGRSRCLPPGALGAQVVAAPVSRRALALAVALPSPLPCSALVGPIARRARARRSRVLRCGGGTARPRSCSPPSRRRPRWARCSRRRCRGSSPVGSQRRALAGVVTSVATGALAVEAGARALTGWRGRGATRVPPPSRLPLGCAYLWLGLVAARPPRVSRRRRRPLLSPRRRPSAAVVASALALLSRAQRAPACTLRCDGVRPRRAGDRGLDRRATGGRRCCSAAARARWPPVSCRCRCAAGSIQARGCGARRVALSSRRRGRARRLASSWPLVLPVCVVALARSRRPPLPWCRSRVLQRSHGPPRCSRERSCRVARTVRAMTRSRLRRSPSSPSCWGQRRRSRLAARRGGGAGRGCGRARASRWSPWARLRCWPRRGGAADARPCRRDRACARRPCGERCARRRRSRRVLPGQRHGALRAPSGGPAARRGRRRACAAARPRARARACRRVALRASRSTGRSWPTSSREAVLPAARPTWLRLAVRLAPAGTLPSRNLRRFALDTSTPGARCDATPAARSGGARSHWQLAAVLLAAPGGLTPAAARTRPRGRRRAGRSRGRSRCTAHGCGSRRWWSAGLRTYVIHPTLAPGRRRAVAAAGPAAAALLGVAAVACGVAVRGARARSGRVPAGRARRRSHGRHRGREGRMRALRALVLGALAGAVLAYVAAVTAALALSAAGSEVALAAGPVVFLAVDRTAEGVDDDVRPGADRDPWCCVRSRTPSLQRSSPSGSATARCRRLPAWSGRPCSSWSS